MKKNSGNSGPSGSNEDKKNSGSDEQKKLSGSDEQKKLSGSDEKEEANGEPSSTPPAKDIPAANNLQNQPTTSHTDAKVKSQPLPLLQH